MVLGAPFLYRVLIVDHLGFIPTVTRDCKAQEEHAISREIWWTAANSFSSSSSFSLSHHWKEWWKPCWKPWLKPECWLVGLKIPALSCLFQKLGTHHESDLRLANSLHGGVVYQYQVLIMSHMGLGLLLGSGLWDHSGFISISVAQGIAKPSKRKMDIATRSTADG